MGSMKDQLGDTLFAAQPRGETFVAERDGKRLNAQAQRVMKIVSDGKWHTLSEIARETGDPEASISARLRDIRAAGHTVEREYVRGGLHKYRVRHG